MRAMELDKVDCSVPSDTGSCCALHSPSPLACASARGSLSLRPLLPCSQRVDGSPSPAEWLRLAVAAAVAAALVAAALAAAVLAAAVTAAALAAALADADADPAAVSAGGAAAAVTAALAVPVLLEPLVCACPVGCRDHGCDGADLLTLSFTRCPRLDKLRRARARAPGPAGARAAGAPTAEGCA